MILPSKYHLQAKSVALSSFFVAIASLILVVWPIPLLSQVVPFFACFYLPGLLLLYILRIDYIDYLETHLYSFALSLFLLMFTGLAMNFLYPFIGVTTPLSKVPIILTLTVLLVVLCIVVHRLDTRIPVLDIPDGSYAGGPAVLILPIIFLVASLFGIHLMNVNGNNAALLFVLPAVLVYNIMISIRKRQFFPPLYPFSLFMTGFSLLLMFSLRTNHIVGVDIHGEYYFYQLTESILRWDISRSANAFNSLLSVTVLPTICTGVLNISPEYVLKVIFPFFFSLVPVVVYTLSKRYINDYLAFLSALLIISHRIYLSMVTITRQEIATFFLALAFLHLFNKKKKTRQRQLLFLIFGVSIIASHYSTVYYFLAILFALLLATYSSQISCRSRDSHKAVSIKALAFFSVVAFLWYGQVSETPFLSFVEFFQYTFSKMSYFFLLELRSEAALSFLGLGSVNIPHILAQIDFFAGVMVKILILAGLFSLLRNYLFRDSHLLKIAMWLNVILLLLTVLLPAISLRYNAERLYVQALILLSSAFPIGSVYVSKRVKTRIGALTCAYLILGIFFLSQTGVIAQIYGYPLTMSLNNAGVEYDKLRVSDQEVTCAEWTRTMRIKNLWGDHYGLLRLWSYGGIPYPFSSSDRSEESRMLRIDAVMVSSYVYLRHTNLIEKKVSNYPGLYEDLANYTGEKMDIIYHNGDSGIAYIHERVPP